MANGHDAELRAAIVDLQAFEVGANTATAASIDLVILAAQSTLSTAVATTATSWLVWSSFKSGSGWRKQIAQFDTQREANTAAQRMIGAPDAYAYPTVTGPHTQQVPG